MSTAYLSLWVLADSTDIARKLEHSLTDALLKLTPIVPPIFPAYLPPVIAQVV